VSCRAPIVTTTGLAIVNLRLNSSITISKGGQMAAPSGYHCPSHTSLAGGHDS
jgi:hypothetical protein